MNEMPLKQIIDAALSKIGSVADVNTVIGDPITLPDGVTVIPFSKVSVGFASGGSDIGTKHPKPDGEAYFAGGNGAGVSVTPLGFIISDKSGVRLISIADPASYGNPADPVNKALDGINGVINKAPDIVEKIKDLYSDYKTKREEKAAEKAAKEAEEAAEAVKAAEDAVKKAVKD